MSASDGAATRCDATVLHPTSSASSVPGGYSRATSSMCSARSTVVTLMTNSPVRSMLIQVSFGSGVASRTAPIVTASSGGSPLTGM